MVARPRRQEHVVDYDPSYPRTLYDEQRPLTRYPGNSRPTSSLQHLVSSSSKAVNLPGAVPPKAADEGCHCDGLYFGRLEKRL